MCSYFTGWQLNTISQSFMFRVRMNKTQYTRDLGGFQSGIRRLQSQLCYTHLLLSLQLYKVFIPAQCWFSGFSSDVVDGSLVFLDMCTHAVDLRLRKSASKCGKREISCSMKYVGKLVTAENREVSEGLPREDNIRSTSEEKGRSSLSPTHLL